ncbi:MAG: M1 family metallopeptidase [Polyangiaceae bacterium]
MVLLVALMPTAAPRALADDSAAHANPAKIMLNHAEDVVDYDIHAELDPVAHLVHGRETIVWRNVSNAPVHEIWLHLYLNAFKNEDSLFLSEPVGRFRGGGHVQTWGAIDVQNFELVDTNVTDGSKTNLWPLAELHRESSSDETDVRVPLPHDVAPGESITLASEFEDKLPSIVERTGFDGSFHMVAQWFPKIAKIEPNGTFAHFPFHRLAEFYSDFGSYDVTIDVPESFVIGATGPLLDSKIEKGRRIEHHAQNDIHDFAWTAWDHFKTTTTDIDGVHVTALFPPDFDAIAAREIATMQFAIPHFKELYGPYPYSVLTLVHPPTSAGEAGGMEYPTLITTGGELLMPRAILQPELVTVHEFGHQYFYGLLASNEEQFPFLDEGVNSFAEQESLGVWRGSGSGGSFFGLSVSDLAAHAMNARSQAAAVADPAYAFPTGGAYGSLVYSRTATILETFRRAYGDAPFMQALGNYTRRFRFRHPTPDDFIGCFRETLGDGAARELHAALFERGAVDYVALDINAREVMSSGGMFDFDGKRETVTRASRGGYEGSVLVERRGPLHLPVDIDLVFESGARERRHWDGYGATTRIFYKGSDPLRYALVDPDDRILLDENRANNRIAVGGDASIVQLVPAAPRALERLSYWASVVLQVLAP